MFGCDQEQSHHECSGSRHRSSRPDGDGQEWTEQVYTAQAGLCCGHVPKDSEWKTPAQRSRSPLPALPVGTAEGHGSQADSMAPATRLGSTRHHPQRSEGNRLLTKACAPETTECS